MYAVLSNVLTSIRLHCSGMHARACRSLPRGGLVCIRSVIDSYVAFLFLVSLVGETSLTSLHVVSQVSLSEKRVRLSTECLLSLYVFIAYRSCQDRNVGVTLGGYFGPALVLL